MRNVALIFTLLLALIAPGAAFIPFAYAQSVEAVATGAKPSVAAILTEKPDGYFSGTGFMAGDHLVVTAYHVVEGARRILLRFPNHPPVDASVVSRDINGGLIKGTWVGVLIVGLGKYPVEGTWTAIRIQ